MTNYTLSVNKFAFNSIVNKKKKIEGRLKRGFFKKNNLKKNDIIKFINNEATCIVKVLNIVEYLNILDYLNSENLQEIIPNIDTVENAYIHYNRFYSKKNLDKYKMLAIKFIIE